MLTKSDMQRLEQIEETQIKNGLFLQICATYLNEYEHLVTENDMRLITAGQKSLEEYAFSSLLCDSFVEDRDLARELKANYFIPSVKRLNPEEYKSNPYFQNIPIPDKKIGNFSLSHQKYAPYEGFVRDDFTLFDDFREVCNIGFFDEEFSFPTVFENGVEWMAIKPNEIETMKEPIKRASGRVITFGLGLGYFAYMASLKDEVEEVTVIERSKDVIALFNAHILPHFQNASKIKIIEGDAFELAKNKAFMEKFDYAFVDLWHDTSDGVDLYIKMKKLEDVSENTHFEYWIERSILVTVRKRIFEALIESVRQGKNTLEYKEILKRLEFSYLKEFVKYL